MTQFMKTAYEAFENFRRNLSKNHKNFDKRFQTLLKQPS